MPFIPWRISPSFTAIFYGLYKLSTYTFDDEADTWVLETHNDHVLGIGRYYQHEKLLALFNFSDEKQIAWVQDLSVFTDLVTGERRDAGAVELPAGGYLWLYQTL